MDLKTIVDELIELWRRRQAWHRAEKSLTLQCKAMCRRLCDGEKTEAGKLYKSAFNGGKHPLAGSALVLIDPLIFARDHIKQSRAEVEKRGRELVRQLPTWKWLQNHPLGIAELGIFGIIGECGDLKNYAGPAKLWKRMCVGVMPDGTRQRRISGDKEAAIAHGYSAARRAVLWTVGDAIIKNSGPLKAVYDRRKQYLITRSESRGLKVIPAATLKKKTDKSGFVSVGHIHNDAKRYMEKRLLLKLWQAWRADVQAIPDE